MDATIGKLVAQLPALRSSCLVPACREAVNSREAYASVRMDLRAPRVAIVVDGGEHWQYWVRLALHAATYRWGGSGFILVPHDGGQVHDLIAQAAVAYDPDYVVLMQTTLHDRETVRPGETPIRVGGRELGGEERERFVAENRDWTLPNRPGEQARSHLADICSVHRRRMQDGDDWMEDLTLLSVADAQRQVPHLTAIPNVPSGPVLSMPAQWTGSVGVAVAGRCGVMDYPERGSEPELDAEEERDLLRWLLSFGDHGEPAWDMVWFPTAAMSVIPKEQPVAFHRTEHALVDIRTGFPRNETTVLVVGDSPTDFALALAWNRIYGQAVWLPEAWWPTDDEIGMLARLTLQVLVDRAESRGETVTVASTSVQEDEVNEVVAALQNPPLRRMNENGTYADAYETVISAANSPGFPLKGRRHLGIVNQWDQQFAIPVVEDDHGGVAMATPPPSQPVQHPDLRDAGDLTWQVDAVFRPTQLPPGRGIDGRGLVAENENPDLTWLRSSRNGISYPSHRYDFALGGSSLESQLATLKLREPSLLEWAQEVAKRAGLSAELSPAGLRVEILRRLWGSREELSAAMSGPLLRLFKAFNPSARSTARSYPDGHGVALYGDGYLSFAGMAAHVAESLDVNQLRERVDRLLVSGIIRRGLIIDCASCGRAAFTVVDDLAQMNPCPRCGSDNQLTQPRWRMPHDEPTWYYDLHAGVRELLTQNGEVPLLLSEFLRASTRSFTDSPEIEFCNIETGDPEAEIDLLALADGRVIIGEVKSTTSLGTSEPNSRSAQKLAHVAGALRADEIVIVEFRTFRERCWACRWWPAGADLGAGGGVNRRAHVA